MKELSLLVSEEARHRTAHVLAAREKRAIVNPLDEAQIKDQLQITTLAAKKDTEHGEANYQKFLKLRCAELMFEFCRAANIAAKYGDAERMSAYERLAETIKTPEKARQDYLEALKPAANTVYA